MNLMLPDSGLLFWMTLIFVIVFLVLAKFGFPIITGMVEKRTKRIDDAIAAAREAEEKLQGLALEQQRLVGEARAEHERILKAAAVEREKLIASAQEQARKEAAKIMEDTRVRIQEEKEAALREIRREVAEVAVAVAEQLVRKELSSEQGQREYLDKVVDEYCKIVESKR